MSAGTQERLETALAWASRGVAVLPVRRGGKAPLTRRGMRDATTDPNLLRHWWARWPGANVAIATGAPGVDVLDVDVRGAQTGWPALWRLRETGVLPGGGPIVRTPSVINGRSGPVFVVCDEPCRGERSSSIQCYQLVVVDVMERRRLPRFVGGVAGAGSCPEATSGSPGREG
jgi:hypothetical protein